MAFRLTCTLFNYEFRGTRSGKSDKTGQPWLSLILESPEDSSQIDVSVPVDLQADVYQLGLRKGDLLNVPVLAVSAKDYSFVRMANVPTLCPEVEDVSY